MLQDGFSGQDLKIWVHPFLFFKGLMKLPGAASLRAVYLLLEVLL